MRRLDIAPRSRPAAGTRICFYTRSADPSGMGAHMLDLVAALVSRYDVSVLCRTSEKARWLFDGAQELGARTVALPSPHDPAPPGILSELLRSHRVAGFHGHAGSGWEDRAGFRVPPGNGFP